MTPKRQAGPGLRGAYPFVIATNLADFGQISSETARVIETSVIGFARAFVIPRTCGGAA